MAMYRNNVLTESEKEEILNQYKSGGNKKSFNEQQTTLPPKQTQLTKKQIDDIMAENERLKRELAKKTEEIIKLTASLPKKKI